MQRQVRNTNLHERSRQVRININLSHDSGCHICKEEVAHACTESRTGEGDLVCDSEQVCGRVLTGDEVEDAKSDCGVGGKNGCCTWDGYQRRWEKAAWCEGGNCELLGQSAIGIDVECSEQA